MTVFSFHPVKHITTGEGGMVVTSNSEFAKRMRLFRNHGIDTDFRQREKKGTWYYELIDLGYNYRITDINCALGLSQLKKLPDFIKRRRKIATQYSKAFVSHPAIEPLEVRHDVIHSYHLYVVFIDFKTIGADRREFYQFMHDNGIGVNIHYMPLHLHPYYRRMFNTVPEMCPISIKAYEKIISLPIFPSLKDSELEYVIHTINKFKVD